MYDRKKIHSAQNVTDVSFFVVPGENTTRQQWQKDDTEVIAKGISAKGIQKDNMDAPMKNVAEDLQPGPSLQSRKHSKTTTSLEAFMVKHISHLTDFVLS